MSPPFSVGPALKNWFASRWLAPRRRPRRAVKWFSFDRLPLRLEQLEDRTVRAAVSASQWANNPASPPGWITGNANAGKSILQEGDSVAYRDVFTSLQVGGTYVITIGWDTTIGGLHALDYLTSYNYTWHGGTGSGTSVDGRALDGTGLPATTPFTTLQIPVDPNINSGPNSNNFMLPGRTPVGSPTNPPNQFFTMYNATITAASGYQLYPMIGNTTQTLAITFIATSPTAVLTWGGHIASQ